MVSYVFLSWPRFSLVVVATTSRRDNKVQMIRPYVSQHIFHGPVDDVDKLDINCLEKLQACQPSSQIGSTVAVAAAYNFQKVIFS
jgi:hypothetical protein